MNGTVLAQWGTGLAETVVRRAAHGFVWERSPGPDVRAEPCHQPRPVPRGFAGRAAAASSDRFVFALATVTSGGAYAWTAPGGSSAAHLLMDAALTEEAERAAVAAETFGRHLRAFHRAAPGPDPDHAYPPLGFAARLERWMGSGTGSRGAAVWHGILRRGLGPDRWDSLVAYAHEAMSAESVSVAAPATVAIGWATLGNLIIPEGGDSTLPPSLLCGDHGCVAAPEADLGCLLGEMYEIQDALTRHGAPARQVAAWRRALLRGYGPQLDTGRAARTAVVRIAAHTHDFAAFVGFHMNLQIYVGLLADLLDSGGAETTPDEGES